MILAPAFAGATTLPKLLGPNPYALYARVAQILHPPAPVVPGIHPSAVVEPGARVAPSACIGPQAYVAGGPSSASACRSAPAAPWGGHDHR